MKRIYFLVGIDPTLDTDWIYPCMYLLEDFFKTERVHNIKMYAHGNTYKLDTHPIYAETFSDNPDGLKVHMISVYASETFISFFKQYLDEDNPWEKRKVKPYLEFEKDENGNIVPTKWYDEKFKEYLGL